MKKIIILLPIFLSTGCATIVKDRMSIVVFQGDPNIDTEITSPYGSTKLSNGMGSMAMNNSQKDIPIQIICNKQRPVSTFLPTKYSIGAGVFGNIGLLFLYIVPGVVGFIVDGAGDTAYSPVSPMNVNQYCSKPAGKTGT